MKNRKKSGGSSRFGYQGRMGRADYLTFAVILLPMLCVACPVALVNVVAFVITSPQLGVEGGPSLVLESFIGLFVIVVLCACLLLRLHSAMTVKRLRDLGVSGWWYAGYLGVQYAVAAYVFRGPNPSYGAALIPLWVLDLGLVVLPGDVFSTRSGHVSHSQKLPESPETEA